MKFTQPRTHAFLAGYHTSVRNFLKVRQGLLRKALINRHEAPYSHPIKKKMKIKRSQLQASHGHSANGVLFPPSFHPCLELTGMCGNVLIT